MFYYKGLIKCGFSLLVNYVLMCIYKAGIIICVFYYKGLIKCGFSLLVNYVLMCIYKAGFIRSVYYKGVIYIVFGW